MPEPDKAISPSEVIDPFAVKDCALIALATGWKAHNLSELYYRLQTVPEASVYYHYWGGLLLPRFEEREFNNDFAAWARHCLHDHILAERLAVVDPGAHQTLAGLRAETLEIIEQRLDELEGAPAAKPGQQFQFIMSRMVVFDTGMRIRTPEEMAGAIPSFSAGAVFYHFIDARRRAPLGTDDFSGWLSGFGPQAERLTADMAGLDPYFTTLTGLRQKIAAIFAHHAKGGSHEA